MVISCNTAFTYKGRLIGAKRVGRQLNVRYVLEGSVQRSGNLVRINAQLIDAERDVHLWAEQFEHGVGDLFPALQKGVQDKKRAGYFQADTGTKFDDDADRRAHWAAVYANEDFVEGFASKPPAAADNSGSQAASGRTVGAAP